MGGLDKQIEMTKEALDELALHAPDSVRLCGTLSITFEPGLAPVIDVRYKVIGVE